MTFLHGPHGIFGYINPIKNEVVIPEVPVVKSLPIFYDFSILPDGIVSDWNGSTYSLVGGKIVNTPALGDNLYDVGADTIESGTYNWTTGGSNTLSNDAGELKVEYVNNDTAFTQMLSNAKDLSADLVAAWHMIYTFDLRVSAGATVRTFLSATNNYIHNYNTVAKTSNLIAFMLNVPAPTMTIDQLSAGESVWLDNLSLRRIDPASLFATPSLDAVGNTHIRAQYTSIGSAAVSPGVHQFGLVSKLDNRDNPQNYIIAILNRNANNQLCLYKVVAGNPPTVTRLITAALGTSLIDETYLEIRWNGDNCSLWHDNAQIGSTQTISDVTIKDNVLHGVYSTGPSKLTSFAMAVNPTGVVVGYIGGSITWQDVGTSPGYRRKTTAWMRNTHLSHEIAEIRNDVNGQIAWEEQARLQQGQWTTTPNEILVDLAANHLSNDDFENSTIEALIRYLRVTYPSARLLLPIFGVWATIASTTTTGSSATRRAALVALAQHYDLDYVDVGAAMETAIAAGHTLSEWYTHPDLTHPNAAGHAYISTLLRSYLGLSYILGGAAQWTGNLLDYARINVNSDYYDDAFLLTNGVDNAGETGTGWSTTLPAARTSSTANDTISFTGTFRSFGLLHTNTGQIQWSIDGGAYSGTINLAVQKATFLITSGLAYIPHTVTFKVISGAPVFRQFDAI